MSSTIGAALRCCVLACCVLAALSSTTVTQHSSSAWGSLGGGRPAERGTSVSHSTETLPDQPDLTLEGRFGGAPRRPSAEPGLGLRGGFGSRRQPEVSPGVPQQPAPGADGIPQQPVAGADGIPPQPVAGTDGGPLQPVPSFDVGQGVPHQPFPSLGAGFPRQSFPGFGFPQHTFPDFGAGQGVPPQQPVPSLGAGNDVPQQPSPIPAAGHGAHQHPISGVNAIHDAYRRLLGQYPNFNFHTGARQPWPVFPQQQQPGVDLRGSFGTGLPQPQPAGPVTPAAGGTEAAGSAQDTSAQDGTVAVNGSAFPSPRPQNAQPSFQLPDLNAYVNQLTAQTFQNLARGMTFGSPQRRLTPGGTGVQMTHTFGGVAPGPGQPPVQSQHASVDSVSFQSSQPGAATPQTGFESTQLSTRFHSPPSGQPGAFQGGARGVPRYGYRAPHLLQQVDANAAWSPYRRPAGWPHRQ